MRTVADIIEREKSSESPEITLMLARNKILPVFIVAWMQSEPSMTETDVDDASIDPMGDIWEVQSINHAHIAMLAGESIGSCRMAMSRLIGLKIIYPDGTIHRYAQQYIKIIASRLITKQAKDAKK